MTAIPPNTLVQNRYLVVQTIGTGETGEVYLGVDQWSGSAVALKRTAGGADTGALETASKTLANLRHPVLPKVIDNFTDDGQHFLVMEHITGENMQSRLEEARKPFPLTWTMFWADQMLDALNYLHSHQPPIVHGDIKPANFKLTDENHIVLLDHNMGKPGSVAAENQRRVNPFASPECLRGERPTPSCDLYSFAASFYELMTNLTPPDASKRFDAVRSGLPDPLISPFRANPEIPMDVSEVLIRGLDLSPEKRFQAAVEMQRDMRRAYKKNKDAMSARTLMFDSGEQPTVPLSDGPVSRSDAVTEDSGQIRELTAAAATMVDEVPTKTHVEPADDTAAPTEILPASVMDGIKQGDIKTEEYPADSPVPWGGTPPAQEPTPVSSPVSAQGTAPTVQTPSYTQAAAASLSGSRPAMVSPSQQAPQQKRSKAGIVVGLLVAFLLIGGIGAVGAWYAYSRYYKADVASPTPTATPAASPSPVQEVVSNTATNSGTNTATTPNVNTASVDNRVTVTSTTPAPVKQQPVLPARTPRTVQPPSTKPSAKPPTGDDRTIIKQ